MSKEDLREMIINNQWEKVFKTLQEITRHDSVIFQEVGILTSEFKDLKSKGSSGELNYQEQTQRRSQITRGLLNLVDQLTDNEKTQQAEVPPKSQPNIEKPEAKPTRTKFKILNWIVGISGLFLAFLALRPYIFQTKAPDFQRVVINLHGPQGILDNPLAKGVVSIEAVEADFVDQSPLGTNGHAIFDSVRINLLGQKIMCALDSSLDYVLKDPTKEYLLAEKINVEIKQVTKLKEPKPKPEDNKSNVLRTLPKSQIDCPNHSPTNEPLGIDKPSGTMYGFTAVEGHYTVINSQCRWIPGGWEKNTKGECPSIDPTTQKPPVARSGKVWYAGYYFKEFGHCIWVPGKWGDINKVPPPVYVPPREEAKPAGGD